MFSPTPQPYYQNPYSSQFPVYSQSNPGNVLPPQQIITAKGKSSIDALRMSPNSSILIADETAPIVWKCTSDGLGNVSAEAFDIVPHKDEAKIQQENLQAAVLNIDERLKRLEANYNDTQQSYTERNGKQQYPTESRSNQADGRSFQKHQKSAGSPQPNDAE